MKAANASAPVNETGATPGSDIMIVGAGPVGTGVLLTSQCYSLADITVVDMDGNRLAKAHEVGATHTLNPASEDVNARVAGKTEGLKPLAPHHFT